MVPISPKSSIGAKSYAYFTPACQAGISVTTFVVAYHICDALSRRSSALGRNQLLSDDMVVAYHIFDALSQMSLAIIFSNWEFIS